MLLGSGLLVAGLVGLAALVVAVFVITDDEPPPDDAVTWPISPLLQALAPEVPEEPEPTPVEGEVEVAEIADLSITESRLVAPGSAENEPVPVDEEAVDALVAAIAAWLDEHLTDLQADGEGRVAEVGLVGPEGTGDLAGPGAVVETAAYTFIVGARGGPEWVRVRVEVTTEDGDEHAAIFAFTGHEEPELQGVEAHT